MKLKKIFKEHLEKRLEQELGADINDIKREAISIKRDIASTLTRFKITYEEIAHLLNIDYTYVCRYLSFGKCQRNPITNLELYGDIIQVLKKRVSHSHIIGIQAVKVLEHRYKKLQPKNNEKTNTEN